MRLILYTKPGCHLCEGLQEKLAKIQNLDLKLDIRDITQRQEWFNAYQFEIPVLQLQIHESHPIFLLPRPSPRATVSQLEQMLKKHLSGKLPFEA